MQRPNKEKITPPRRAGGGDSNLFIMNQIALSFDASFNTTSRKNSEILCVSVASLVGVAKVINDPQLRCVFPLKSSKPLWGLLKIGVLFMG